METSIGDVMEQKNQYQLVLQNVINVYRDQLKKFYKIGIGGRTEFNTVVTELLIDCTKRRLLQLTRKQARLMRYNPDGL